MKSICVLINGQVNYLYFQPDFRLHTGKIFKIWIKVDTYPSACALRMRQTAQFPPLICQWIEARSLSEPHRSIAIPAIPWHRLDSYFVLCLVACGVDIFRNVEDSLAAHMKGGLKSRIWHGIRPTMVCDLWTWGTGRIDNLVIRACQVHKPIPIDFLQYALSVSKTWMASYIQIQGEDSIGKCLAKCTIDRGCCGRLCRLLGRFWIPYHGDFVF